MKRWKLEQVARVRHQVEALRLRRHVIECICCQMDLDAIAEAADSPCAEVLLRQVSQKVDVRLSRGETGP